MLRLGLDLDGEIKLANANNLIWNYYHLEESVFSIRNENIKIIFHLDPNTLEKMFSTQELIKFLT